MTDNGKKSGPEAAARALEAMGHRTSAPKRGMARVKLAAEVERLTLRKAGEPQFARASRGFRRMSTWRLT
jgi:hypothetical protein